MIPSLPLNERYSRLGAVLGEVQGWRVPLTFNSVAQEVGAARGAAAILDLGATGKLQVRGEDHKRFLHRMLTQEIEKRAAGSGCYAALLEHKGHILSDMRTLIREGEILLLTPPHCLTRVRETLGRYIVADRVDIEDVTASYGLLSIQGPHAPDVYFQLFGELPPEGTRHDHHPRALEGAETLAIRSDHTGDGGFDLLLPADRCEVILERLLRAGADFGLRLIGHLAWNILRLEAGIPWYGQDMDEGNLIQEALLEEAVSTTKGCYVGQETVARLRARGHVNRQLCGLKFAGNQAAAAKAPVIQEDQEIGWVTSSEFSPTLQRAIALAYVRREYIQPGSGVVVASGEARLEAFLSSLPFYPASY